MFKRASSSIPTPEINQTPAPGKRGPSGLAPRTNYSRVNTVAPPEAGAEISTPEGDSMKTASDVSMAARPFGLQDMVKAAMGSALSKVKVSSDARRELTEARSEKTASANSDHVSTQYAEKVASTLSYMADELEKEASEFESSVGPGRGPGALELSAATGKEGPSPGGVNRGTAKTPVPMHTPMGKARPTDPMTQLENDMHSPPGGMTGKEAAAPVSAIRKVAAQRKMAEDAINPAKISGPAAVPPDASDATQSRGSFGGNDSLIASNQAAINATKGQAKAPVKSDMKKHLDETAMADGEVLRAAFDSTGQAGTKMSSAKGTFDKATKTAAARTLLARLAKNV